MPHAWMRSLRPARWPCNAQAVWTAGTRQASAGRTQPSGRQLSDCCQLVPQGAGALEGGPWRPDAFRHDLSAAL